MRENSVTSFIFFKGERLAFKYSWIRGTRTNKKIPPNTTQKGSVYLFFLIGIDNIPDTGFYSYYENIK